MGRRMLLASILSEKTGTLDVSLCNSFDPEQMFSKKKHYTAGCGRGVTFFSMTDVKKFNKVNSDETYSLTYLLKKRAEFAQNSPLYLETGGMHGACIILEDGSIEVREDIGRHNAVDKIIGYAIRKRLQPDRLVLLTTGRVSYEMLSKAAKFGFAVIGSRTAATKQAIQLARFLNIEVVGYLRGKMATVYTSARRINDDLNTPAVENSSHIENCPAPAPSPSSRFGQPDEVKERLHRSALQRLSGLTKALPLSLKGGKPSKY